MISFVAHLRTAPGVGSAALRTVSAHLRTFDHIFCAPGQYLVTLPAGTALVDESRTGLLVDIVVATEDAAARACATLAHEVAAAVGESTVMVSWRRRELAPSAQ